MGIDKNDKLAAYWYAKSAIQDNKYAQYNMGVSYENGNGVDKNLSLAVYWYAKSAIQEIYESRQALQALQELQELQELLQNNSKLCKTCTGKNYTEIYTVDKNENLTIDEIELNKIIIKLQEKANKDIDKIIQENNKQAKSEVNKVIQEKEKTELENKKNNILCQLKESIEEKEKILKNDITNQINLIKNNKENKKPDELKNQLEQLKSRIENILSCSINNNIAEYIKYNNLLATKYRVGNEITVDEKVDINSLDIEITNNKGGNIYKKYKELYNEKISEITKEMIKTDTLVSAEGLLSYKNNEILWRIYGILYNNNYCINNKELAINNTNISFNRRVIEINNKKYVDCDRYYISFDGKDTIYINHSSEQVSDSTPKECKHILHRIYRKKMTNLKMVVI